MKDTADIENIDQGFFKFFIEACVARLQDVMSTIEGP